jgi:hypothetical protein
LAAGGKRKNMMGVPLKKRQVFRFNLFIGEKPLKRISASTLNAAWILK